MLREGSHALRSGWSVYQGQSLKPSQCTMATKTLFDDYYFDLASLEDRSLALVKVTKWRGGISQRTVAA